jgi:hypothetical protein
MHKHYSETKIVPKLLTMMVNFEHPKAWNVAMLLGHMTNNEKERRQHILKWNQTQSTNLNVTKHKE